jgi:ABC-type phosphate transport system substrate-binding protein
MTREILLASPIAAKLWAIFRATLGAVVFFVAIGATPAKPWNIAVIVHRDNPIKSITPSDLKKYYSDIVTTWPDSAHIRLYDLPISDTVRKAFSDKILHKRPEIVTMEWANKRITNTAKNPPSTVRSQKVMLMKVAKDKLAIGYLPVEMVKKNLVKVILILE